MAQLAALFVLSAGTIGGGGRDVFRGGELRVRKEGQVFYFLHVHKSAGTSSLSLFPLYSTTTLPASSAAAPVVQVAWHSCTSSRCVSPPPLNASEGTTLCNLAKVNRERVATDTLCSDPALRSGQVDTLEQQADYAEGLKSRCPYGGCNMVTNEGKHINFR